MPRVDLKAKLSAMNEKVKKARLERERERQERLELEELEQRYLQQFRLQIIVLVRNGLSNVANSCSLYESGSKFFLMYRIAARIFTKSESLLKLPKIAT